MISGYLHPSFEQAGIYEFISETVEGALEIVTKDVRTRGKGLDITLRIMNNATMRLYELFTDSKAPFGEGEWIDYDIAKSCISCGKTLSSTQSRSRGICIECNKPRKSCASCGRKLTGKKAKQKGICYTCYEKGYRR